MPELPTPVIKVNLYEPLVLTASEYEALAREVEGMALVDGPSPLSRVLVRVLADNRSRYAEVKAILEAREQGEAPIGTCDDCGESCYKGSIRPWACSSRCYANVIGICDPDY